MTGISTQEEYRKNPVAQETYQIHLAKKYKESISELKQFVGKNIPDEALLFLQHYLGLGDSKLYLDVLNKTKNYDSAQEAVNNSIKKRVGNLPKNLPIKDYLVKFITKLKSLK